MRSFRQLRFIIIFEHYIKIGLLEPHLLLWDIKILFINGKAPCDQIRKYDISDRHNSHYITKPKQLRELTWKIKCMMS